jgi:hypothetical protein
MLLSLAAVGSEHAVGFQAAAAFAGSREGRLFAMGCKGLGYYLDPSPAGYVAAYQAAVQTEGAAEAPSGGAHAEPEAASGSDTGEEELGLDASSPGLALARAASGAWSSDDAELAPRDADDDDDGDDEDEDEGDDAWGGFEAGGERGERGECDACDGGGDACDMEAAPGTQPDASHSVRLPPLPPSRALSLYALAEATHTPVLPTLSATTGLQRFV